MKINWNKHKVPSPCRAAIGDETEHVVYLTEVSVSSDSAAESVIGECIEKSVLLLSENITDESLFMLFEWDVVSSTLSIVVTDDKKEYDSPYVVKCCFKGLDEDASLAHYASEDEDINHSALKVKYWIRDYLTTCSGYMRYSLVATFHSSDRNSCVFL